MTRRNKWLLAAGGAGLGLLALHCWRTPKVIAHPHGTPCPEPPEKPSSPRRESRGVSRKYDSLFRDHGNGLPVAYLRALAKRESNLNPKSAEGAAWGLMQVIEVVRRDFNKREGTRYTRQDLLDPQINIHIGTTLLRRIIRSYVKNHPDVANMQPDWTNRNFVELLTFGWNAGYSERGGVGKVAHYLERKGRHDDITIDTIHAAAKAARASRHLSNAKKVRWCKGVAGLYLAETRRDEE